MTMSYGSLSAQDKIDTNTRRNNPKQRIEMRVQRMQKELNLDDNKAAQFSPLYKEYLQTILSLKKQKPGKKDKKMSDEQIDQLVMSRFDQKEKLIDIQKDYYLKFRKVLSPVQARKALNFQKNHQSKNKNLDRCNKRHPNTRAI